MMKVPFSVIIGKSPMKTVCSLISPVWAFMKRAVTKRGREKVMSFSLHSSSEYFGGSNSGSASSSFREPVKSSIGEMSVRVSAIPSSRNQVNESRCTATRSGSGMTSRSFANEKRRRAARRAKASLLTKTRRRPSRGEEVKGHPETPNGQHSDSLRWLATASSRLHRAHDLRRIRLTLMQVKGGEPPADDPPPVVFLLELDGGAGGLELGLGLLGVLLGNFFQDGLGGAVDQVLGLLQAQAGERPDLLDDLDLLVAGGGEDDVELVLLLDGLGRRAAPTGAGADVGHRGSGGGHAELLLEGLEEIVELEDGHVLENVEELGGAHRCHGAGASCAVRSV